MRLVIPYDQIEKNSRVIIYGAGIVGRRFWESNCQVKWFDCVQVVDKQYYKIKDFPCPVFSPSKIEECLEYDYILLALQSKVIRREVLKELENRGVDRKKIIYKLNWCDDNDVDIFSYYDDGIDKIRIALMIHGGMGDHVVSLRLYDDLIRQIPMAIVDVYGSSIAEGIFELRDNLGGVYTEELDSNSNVWDKYDLILDLTYVPRVEKFNCIKISRINSELAKKLEVLVENNKYEDVNRTYAEVPNTTLWRLMLERARILCLDRYSVMRTNGFFEIADKKVEIRFDEKYRDLYESLELGKSYITVNYGTGKTHDGNPQVKIWPQEYHEELNVLIKENYPDLTIVQLGGADSERLKGVDQYIFGEKLSVVKYILRDSICHIDCEGGLVHLASQIGTKCFVMFGPTPVWFYGYDMNCNIKSDKCGECFCLTDKWMTKCFKYDKPECMYAIKPKDVFPKIKEYLNEKGLVFKENQ